MNKTYVLYFSPVGTTRLVAEAIYSGFGMKDLTVIDLCDPLEREKAIEFTNEDLVLMVFPVYAGRVVRIPRYYFNNIEGNGAKAITVVTYGNRAYDDALYELSKLAVDSGFEQIAAAAFVCEHSFDIDLAKDRPDNEDIEYAKTFGRKSVEKLDVMDAEGMNLSLNAHGVMKIIPGNFPFRTQFRHDFGGPLVPETSSECISCGKCARDCPVLAIPSDNFMTTDAKKCITCFRCIRKCPVSARSIPLKDFVDHAKWLTDTYQDRKEAEIFL